MVPSSSALFHCFVSFSHPLFWVILSPTPGSRSLLLLRFYLLSLSVLRSLPKATSSCSLVSSLSCCMQMITHISGVIFCFAVWHQVVAVCGEALQPWNRLPLPVSSGVLKIADSSTRMLLRGEMEEGNSLRGGKLGENNTNPFRIVNIPNPCLSRCQTPLGIHRVGAGVSGARELMLRFLASI